MLLQTTGLAVVLWTFYAAQISSLWQTFWNTNRLSLRGLWVPGRRRTQRWDNLGNKRSAMDRASNYLTLPYPPHSKDLKNSGFFFLACRAHILSTFVKTRSYYGASEVRVLNGHGFNFNIVPSLVWIGCPLIWQRLEMFGDLWRVREKGLGHDDRELEVQSRSQRYGTRVGSINW